MKLRIKANSLRLRVSRGEVERLERTGSVEDAIEFGPGSRLNYHLKVCNDAAAVRVRYEGGAIEVEVPRGIAREWATTDRAGISADQPLDSERALHILIEKDSKCIHKDGGEEEDTYPNPLLSQTST